jgi:hypothetical protein
LNNSLDEYAGPPFIDPEWANPDADTAELHLTPAPPYWLWFAGGIAALVFVGVVAGWVGAGHPWTSV